MSRIAASWIAGLLMAGAPLAYGQPVSAAAGATVNAIVTGGSNGTYYPMAQNLQKHAAPGLEVRESKGSWENIFRLAEEKGVSFAMVQSDVLGYFNQWAKTQPSATQVKRTVGLLRVMLPLHEEEMHILVPSNSKLKYLHEIKGQRIFMGRPGSGPFITGHQVYRTLFGQDPVVVSPEDFKAANSRLEIEGALMKLTNQPGASGPDVDVVFLVGGQPYGAIEPLERERKTAVQYKFLAVDPTHPGTKELLRLYSRASLDRKFYPEILKGSASSDTLAVQAYLVTVQLSDNSRRQFVEDFASNYCRNFDAMLGDPQSHPKWQAVKWKPGTPFPPLAAGWSSVPAGVVSRLTSCGKPKKATPGTVCAVPHPTKPDQCLTK